MLKQLLCDLTVKNGHMSRLKAEEQVVAASRLWKALQVIVLNRD